MLLFYSGSLFAQEKTFYLKSGDKVSGNITAETDSTYAIETTFGSVTINKKDIKPEEAIVYLKSGDKLKGVILSESDEGIKVKAQFGEVSISKEEIDRIDFKSMGAVARGFQRPGQTEEGRWYYGKERLIDIYFDPTGYTVGDNVLYLSLLSWGYGLSDRFQITSKWGGYFWGDLNFRPKYTVFKKGTLKSEHAFAIGGHFHMRGRPAKYQLVSDNSLLGNIWGDTDKRWVRIGYTVENEDWDNDGIVDEIYINDDPTDGDKMWMEYFAAYTISNLKKSGQGRINHTIGATLTTYPGYDPMPRAYYGIHADARRNLKLIFEAFYDPYWALALEFSEESEISEFDFDFGFIYAYSENLQLGIHFQRPWIAFYYKF